MNSNLGKKKSKVLEYKNSDYSRNDQSESSEFSLRYRNKRKNKKKKKKVLKATKDEALIVFERVELRPSTIDNCLHTIIMQQEALK